MSPRGHGNQVISLNLLCKNALSGVEPRDACFEVVHSKLAQFGIVAEYNSGGIEALSGEQFQIKRITALHSFERADREYLLDGKLITYKKEALSSSGSKEKSGTTTATTPAATLIHRLTRKKCALAEHGSVYFK